MRREELDKKEAPAEPMEDKVIESSPHGPNDVVIGFSPPWYIFPEDDTVPEKDAKELEDTAAGKTCKHSDK